MKTGLKLFGDKREKAVKNYLTQIHNMETFVPTTSTKIIKQLRVQALSSLMFFGEKRYDRFKVRGIPGGKK